MAQVDPRIKKLKIQTGVVKRIGKEKLMYAKEATQEEAKLTKMKSDGTDEYVIRKQEEVMNESKAMGPDSKKRLTQARDQLNDMIEKEEWEAAHRESEEFKNAKTELDNANALLAQD